MKWEIRLCCCFPLQFVKDKKGEGISTVKKMYFLVVSTPDPNSVVSLTKQQHRGMEWCTHIMSGSTMSRDKMSGYRMLGYIMWGIHNFPAK
jgi:hypothetical protein